MVAFLAFVPITITVATSIATRTIGKKALQEAIKKYGPTFIKTLQKIGKNDKKIKTTVDKFNKTSKKLEKKSKIEKTKVKKKETAKKKKAKEKKVEEAKPLKKASKAVTTGATTITKNVAKDISQLAKLADKITFGLGGKTLGVGKELVKGTIKTAVKHPVYTAGGIYGAHKAVDIGSKLFKGRAITDTGKGEDITSEVTGGGTTETKGPPLSGGAQGLNNFVDAHNKALSSGEDYFVFEGKYFNVGKTQLSQF